jgi:hypothetical protein
MIVFNDSIKWDSIKWDSFQWLVLNDSIKWYNIQWEESEMNETYSHWVYPKIS